MYIYNNYQGPNGIVGREGPPGRQGFLGDSGPVGSQGPRVNIFIENIIFQFKKFLVLYKQLRILYIIIIKI